MNQLTAAIFRVIDALEGGKELEYDDRMYTTAEEQQSLLESLQNQIVNFAENVNRQALISQNPIPGIQQVEGITPQGFNIAYNDALQRQDEMIADMVESARPEDREALRNTFDALLEKEKESGGKYYDLGKEFGLEFRTGLLDAFSGTLEEALKDESGKLDQFKTPENLGLNFFDTTSAQFNQALSGYGAMVNKLETASGGAFEEEKSWFLPVLQDGIGKPMRLDMRIVQYLLQQILDTEKKQLNGIYNLPTDSSFYVPWWEGFTRPGGGGGGGLGFLGGETTTDETIKASDPYRSLNAKIDRLDEASEGVDSFSTTISDDLSLPINVFSTASDTSLRAAQMMLESALKVDSTQTEWIPGTEQGVPHSYDPNKGYKPPKYNVVKQSPFQYAPGFPAPYGPPGPPFTSMSPYSPFPNYFLPTGEETSMRGTEKGLTDTKVVSTRVNMNFTSNIRLVVDGATLAMVVKKYLGEELATYSDNTASVGGVI
jgi:hypothetical protein